MTQVYHGTRGHLSTPRDGVTLAGTLSVPERPGPAPVILITGSGRLIAIRVFRASAVLCVGGRTGAPWNSSVRTDPRGHGGSTGNAEASTLRDRAADTLAGVDFLRKNVAVDPQHIGLIGHSEGALVWALAAADRCDIAFLVMMAGTGLPVARPFSRRPFFALRGRGVGEPIVRMAAKERRLFELAAAENDDAAAEKRTQEIEDQWERSLGDQERRWLSAMSLPSVKMRVSPWLRDLMVFDPRPARRAFAVRCWH